MAKAAKKTASELNKPTKTAPAIAQAASATRTKSAAVLTLLSAKDGTTIAEISAATGWQNHSVRGFLSGTVRKKLGREIASAVVDGERRYRIAG